MQIFFYKYGAKWSHAIKTLFYPRKMPKQESLHIIFIYVFECFFIEKESVKVYFERKSSDSFWFHSSLTSPIKVVTEQKIKNFWELGLMNPKW